MKPFVSILTPTYNRRERFPIAIHCFKHQTYPQDRMEWIILDDSDEGQDVEELVKNSGIKNVKYIREHTKLLVGAKRNKLIDLAKGDILAFQDDDDYYPAERIRRAVYLLDSYRKHDVNIVGSSLMHIYFCRDSKIVAVGPYGPSHATAATWVFRRKLLDIADRFDDDADKAEEKKFLRGFSIPMVQMNSFDTILVMSHQQNTVDKNKLRLIPDMCKMEDRTSTVKMFTHKDKAGLKFIMDQTAKIQQYLKENPLPEVTKEEVLAEIKKRQDDEEMKERGLSIPVAPISEQQIEIPQPSTPEPLEH
jgi:glycosyltransferase involved in cell wall biosynthesis